MTGVDTGGISATVMSQLLKAASFIRYSINEAAELPAPNTRIDFMRGNIVQDMPKMKKAGDEHQLFWF
jgi:hypothetical protein